METYDNEIALIKKVTKLVPPGVPSIVEDKSYVFCNLKTAGQSEFYKGRQAGLKPELVFTIHLFEYEGQTEIEYESKRYSIIRTYSKNDEEIELVCERKIGDINGKK